MGETDDVTSGANRTERDEPPTDGAAGPDGSGVTLDLTDRANAARAAAASPGRTKHDLRRRIRAARRARPAAEQEADALALADMVASVPEVARASCVTLYASMPGEPGTGPLRAALRARGVRVLLPVVLPEGLLDWAEDTGTLVAPAGFGGDEPAGERLGLDGIRQADVVLVPGLAVDTLGRRLGQGAGYYDRALPRLGPAVPVIAIVHDGEVLDAAVEPVPTEAHDRPVDAVVTPRTFLRLRA